jgi:hypothetical protein
VFDPVFLNELKYSMHLSLSNRDSTPVYSSELLFL